MGKMNKEVEGNLLDNRLLDAQRHETHHVRVGRLFKVVLLLFSLRAFGFFSLERKRMATALTWSLFWVELHF